MRRNKNMSKREIGKVKWFDAKKGYGFISRENADDVFVHYTAIQGDGYRFLKDNQQVEFDVVQGKKGFEARNIVLVNENEQNIDDK